MGLIAREDMVGRNSKELRNSYLGPAKLTALSYQGVEPLSVSFDIAGMDGQFTDTVSANYAPMAQASFYKFLLNELSKRSSMFLKGELTTRYEGVSPKKISFDIIYRADKDFPPREIIERVKILQSFCYPRRVIKGNPPLCVLQVLHLYCLEVYVEHVHVAWHNTWNLMSARSGSTAEDHGLPMGCHINVQCLMHQYPTRDEILEGAGFDSTRFVGTGYSGSLQGGKWVWEHTDPETNKRMQRNQAHSDNTPGLAAFERARNANNQQRQPIVPSPSSNPGGPIAL